MHQSPTTNCISTALLALFLLSSTFSQANGFANLKYIQDDIEEVDVNFDIESSKPQIRHYNHVQAGSVMAKTIKLASENEDGEEEIQRRLVAYDLDPLMPPYDDALDQLIVKIKRTEVDIEGEDIENRDGGNQSAEPIDESATGEAIVEDKVELSADEENIPQPMFTAEASNEETDHQETSLEEESQYEVKADGSTEVISNDQQVTEEMDTGSDAAVEDDEIVEEIVQIDESVEDRSIDSEENIDPSDDIDVEQPHDDSEVSQDDEDEDESEKLKILEEVMPVTDENGNESSERGEGSDIGAIVQEPTVEEHKEVFSLTILDEEPIAGNDIVDIAADEEDVEVTLSSLDAVEEPLNSEETTLENVEQEKEGEVSSEEVDIDEVPEEDAVDDTVEAEGVADESDSIVEDKEDSTEQTLQSDEPIVGTDDVDSNDTEVEGLELDTDLDETNDSIADNGGGSFKDADFDVDMKENTVESDLKHDSIDDIVVTTSEDISDESEASTEVDEDDAGTPDVAADVEDIAESIEEYESAGEASSSIDVEDIESSEEEFIDDAEANEVDATLHQSSESIDEEMIGEPIEEHEFDDTPNTDADKGRLSDGETTVEPIDGQIQDDKDVFSEVENEVVEDETSQDTDDINAEEMSSIDVSEEGSDDENAVPDHVPDKALDIDEVAIDKIPTEKNESGGDASGTQAEDEENSGESEEVISAEFEEDLPYLDLEQDPKSDEVDIVQNVNNLEEEESVGEDNVNEEETVDELMITTKPEITAGSTDVKGEISKANAAHEIDDMGETIYEEETSDSPKDAEYISSSEDDDGLSEEYGYEEESPENKEDKIPIPSTPKSNANDEFVYGLNDLHKFIEEVDPPDELDIGAGGLSIQEVFVGQGVEIIKTRVVKGVAQVKKSFRTLKTKGREKWNGFKEFVDDNFDLNIDEAALTLVEKLEIPYQNVKDFLNENEDKVERVKRVVGDMISKARSFITNLLDGDDYYEEDEEDLDFGDFVINDDDMAEMRRKLMERYS